MMAGGLLVQQPEHGIVPSGPAPLPATVKGCDGGYEPCSFKKELFLWHFAPGRGCATMAT